MDKSNQTQILIVDDEPHISTAIEFLMQQQGYNTECAINGREALEKLPHIQPNLIILDVMMPELNGFELALKIREEEKYAHIPIIFLTAKGTDQDKLEGYGSGGDVYLTKPFDNQRLIHTVQDLLSYLEP